MSKKHLPVSIAQLERRQSAQVRHQRWDRFWTIVILAIAAGMIVLIVAIQISHHL